MWWNKKTEIKVDVQRIQVNLLTSRDTSFYLDVCGEHWHGNKFKRAHTVMSEKLTKYQYIQITEDKWLSTGDIVEIDIKALSPHIISATIRGNKWVIF